MSAGQVVVVVFVIVAGCATSPPSLEPVDWGDAGTLGKDCRFYMGDIDIVRPPLEPCETGLACDMTTLTCASSTPAWP